MFESMIAVVEAVARMSRTQLVLNSWWSLHLKIHVVLISSGFIRGVRLFGLQSNRMWISLSNEPEQTMDRKHSNGQSEFSIVDGRIQDETPERSSVRLHSDTPVNDASELFRLDEYDPSIVPQSFLDFPGLVRSQIRSIDHPRVERSTQWECSSFVQSGIGCLQNCRADTTKFSHGSKEFRSLFHCRWNRDTRQQCLGIIVAILFHATNALLVILGHHHQENVMEQWTCHGEEWFIIDYQFLSECT